jgi:hypothetical protein
VTTYDLLIFQNVKPVGEQLVQLGLGTSGYYTTGVQKVSQSFAIFFMTELGGVVDDPLFGTEFMRKMKAGMIVDESVLQAEFQIAVLHMLDYLANTQLSTTPEDEQLKAAELTDWTLRPGSISIHVRITTAAGTSRVYVMPLEVKP